MPLRALTTPIPEQPIEGTNLGAEIKALRKAKRLTLMVMAGLTNLSASYLSRIERYACDVSIKTLQNLAQVLGVSIGWFFHAEKAPDTMEECYFVRGDARHKLRLGEGKTEELLCPSPDGDLQLLHTRYAPNCAGSDGQRTHERGSQAGDHRNTGGDARRHHTLASGRRQLSLPAHHCACLPQSRSRRDRGRA